MPLRECRFVLPSIPLDDFGLLTSVGTLLDDLKSELAEHFGGATISFGRGLWRTPGGFVEDEPVTIFDVAVDDWAAARTLGAIARRYGKLTGQESVYFRGFMGDVTLIEVERDNG